MSQSAVARAAGISPALFNSMLRGRKIIRAEYVTDICEALKVSPNQLLNIRKIEGGVTEKKELLAQPLGLGRSVCKRQPVISYFRH